MAELQLQEAKPKAGRPARGLCEVLADVLHVRAIHRLRQSRGRRIADGRRRQQRPAFSSGQWPVGAEAAWETRTPRPRMPERGSKAEPAGQVSVVVEPAVIRRDATLIGHRQQSCQREWVAGGKTYQLTAVAPGGLDRHDARADVDPGGGLDRAQIAGVAS